MNSAERETWVALFGDLLVKGWFVLKLWQFWTAGALVGEAGLVLWAQTVLWMIPISIGVQVALSILAGIAQGLIGRGGQMMKDERDRMIRGRGMITGYIVASVGALSGIVAIAWGHGALAGLSLILLGLMAADVSGNLVRLGHYRLA